MTGELLSRLAPHLLVGLSGTSLTARERALLSKYHFAGAVLFGRNISDEHQIRALTDALRALFEGAGGDAPIVAADHEGGRVSILHRAVGVPPSQMAIARTGDHELCRRVYTETARRITRCGVSLCLGPTADINSNPLNPVIGTRSFGERANEVSSFVGSAVAALRGAGLLTCLKHFPGHGSSADDSHVTLPLLGRDIDELSAVDLAPFRRGIEAGADAVMAGHIAPRGAAGPASLDRAIITGLLRDECGFSGVVMTDALEMAGAWMVEHGAMDAAALDRDYSGRGRAFSDVLRLALDAGNDLLLFSKPVERVIDELESCLSGIEGDDHFWHGRFQELSAASLERIGKLRRAAGRRCDEAHPAGGDARDPYREVANRSISLLRDPRSILPLASMEQAEFAFLGHGSDHESDVVKDFCAAVMKLNESGGEARDTAGMRKVVLLLHRRPVTADELEMFLDDAEVVVICDRPYAAEVVPPDKTVLVTYGICDGLADAIARRLTAPKK